MTTQEEVWSSEAISATREREGGEKGGLPQKVRRDTISFLELICRERERDESGVRSRDGETTGPHPHDDIT
jgi:hypothetical protein